MICSLCSPSAGLFAEQPGEQSEEASGLLVEKPQGLQDLNLSTKKGWDQSLNREVGGGGLVEEETLELECVTEEGAQ